MNATLVAGKDLNPVQWDAFVAQSPQGNIYHCHAYLSHLLPGWEAVAIEEGGLIVAAFPFESHKKWGLRYALQPHFAQYLGILFAQKSDQVYKNLEFQKKAIQLIHEALPPDVRFFHFSFAPEFEYDLPLIWLGWQHRMRYTYWVDISGGYESFLQSCASHVRREIKKAEAAGLTIKAENKPETVVEILKTAKPEATRSIAPHFFEALCKNSRHFFETQQSCSLIAYDGERPVAGIVYFFFKNKIIYYQGSTLPEYKNSGAMTRIIAESVRMFGANHQFLDFDGSMIEPIERFFRGFGAFPVRYGVFTLNRLPGWARWAYSLKSS
ncbi:MAG: GNAT family N-acetyltransferase [Saprospiraceae bacterium]